MPLIELTLSPPWSEQKPWIDICNASSKAAIMASPHAGLLGKSFEIEISVKLSDNDEVQKLNGSYRGKDKPTNVLSFPLVQPDLLSSLSNTDDGEILLGDIILAHGVCQAEATEKNVSLSDHVAHLVVHGTLHLLGYDHEEETDALIMEELEVQALSSIGIANPYSETAIKR